MKRSTPNAPKNLFCGRPVTAEFLILLFAALVPAFGHEVSTLYATIVRDASGFDVAVSIRPSELAKFPQADANGDGSLSAEEIKAVAPGWRDYVGESLKLSGDFSPLELAPGKVSMAAGEGGGTVVETRFRIDPKRSIKELGVRFAPEDPFGSEFAALVKVVAKGTVQQVVLNSKSPSWQFSFGEKVSLGAQLVTFIKLGVEHIFLGYDHIAFLIGLIVLGTRLRDLVKIVTAFTLAHSITLTLAALQIVTLPARWIEAGIAASIAYVAAENFWIKEIRHRWVLTFFFGLVHGFGFANVLHELGLPKRGLAAALFSFNLGVEIGQLCIVLLAFPLALWLAKQPYRRKVINAISAVILLFGLGWLVERLFQLSFMPF